MPLSRYWKLALQEIYETEDLRHRFDIIQCILNQDPHALAAFAALGRKWRNGLGGKHNDVAFSRYAIGKRVFVLAYSLTRSGVHGDEWQERSRNIAREAVLLFEATDCVVLLRVKKSREATFDGVYFARLKSSSDIGDREPSPNAQFP